MPTWARNDQLKAAAAGMAVSVALAAWAVVGSGGGHFNFPIILATAPPPLGLFAWPFLAALSCRPMSLRAKRAFGLTIVVHYLSVVAFGLNPPALESDRYWFNIGMKHEGFVVFPAVSLTAYAALNIVLWARFVRARRAA